MPATVLHLLRLRGPAAVLWLVVPVVVDSVDGMGRRGARAHIYEECQEVMTPTIAHRDSAAAVVRIASRLRIRAAREHARPGPVFRRVSEDSLDSSGVAMLEMPRRGEITFQ